ncbi:MAG TPA: ABC transporter ATP-binding protein [Streptosporangiaceae bacterium]|nr:ABC transporter ATP-binding protein [Streptosporangiaceae bacterium]
MISRDVGAPGGAGRAAHAGSGVPVVSLRHVRKSYPAGGRAGAAERLALADVTFDVARGEFACVVGPSGAGKTTLLRCLAGLMPPTSGEALFEGNVLRRVPDRVGVVFQDYSRSLYPWLTVNRNIALPLKVRGVDKATRAKRIAEVLASVGLAGVGRQYPWQLSGGMQQRVAIARSLAYRPDLLLMDEPFASVDAQTRFELEDLILRVRDEFNVTVVFVTHDIDEAIYLADRIVVLSASPGVVAEIVDVALPRPRDQITTKSDERFARYRQKLLGLVMAR